MRGYLNGVSTLATKGTSHQRIQSIIAATGDEELLPADEAVMRSILREVTDREAHEILEEFFDVEPLTLGIYEEFLARGSTWEPTALRRLAEALIFCGFDEQAATVMETLR